MQIVNVIGAGEDYEQPWPDHTKELFAHWILYKAVAEDGEHQVRVAFGTRSAFEQERTRLVVCIDDYPYAEFVGADDFDVTGEVLSEIKVPGADGRRMCRYPEERVPDRYAGLNVVGIPTRLSGKWVHHGWAVVANIADHKTIIALAALRRQERAQQNG